MTERTPASTLRQPSAYGARLYYFLLFLAGITLSMKGLPAWMVMATLTTLLLMPEIFREHWVSDATLSDLARKASLYIIHAMTFALAAYVVGRGLAWL